MNTTANDANLAASTLADPRWAAVVERRPDADGTFFYSVRTTGVYCRPSCGARLPRPENVAFHRTSGDAEAAGFRPCKRCRPGQDSVLHQQAAKVTEACRIVEQAVERSDPVPLLADLADRVGISRYHLHRLFRKHTGLTPREYAAAHRQERLRSRLGRSRSVTDAIFDAGYNSNSRFYATSDDVLGMTPSAWRAGGADTEIRFALGECSLGAILVAKSERGVCAVSLGDDPEALVRELEDRFPRASLVGGDPAFEQLVASIVGMIESPGTGAELPLDVRGTAFQQRVWQALREIPAGKTASYSDIAERIGRPGSVRAVAQACGANPLAVVIPCHRVVRKDGGLSGYRWGIERKRTLLQKEARE